MSDGRLWWMLNVLGLLTLTAAAFTFLGWWLRALVRRDERPASLDTELRTAHDKLADMEGQLHEAEGSLRRCEAELAEVLRRSDSQELQSLRARLHEAEARLAAQGGRQPAAERSVAAPRQEFLPLDLSQSLTVEEMQRVEQERDALRAELDFLKRHLDDSLAFRAGEKTGDDLTRIKGVAKVLSARLNAFGIFTYQQITDWTPQEVEAFGRLMGFTDRVKREAWQGQCRTFIADQKDITSL